MRLIVQAVPPAIGCSLQTAPNNSFVAARVHCSAIDFYLCLPPRGAKLCAFLVRVELVWREVTLFGPAELLTIGVDKIVPSSQIKSRSTSRRLLYRIPLGNRFESFIVRRNLHVLSDELELFIVKPLLRFASLRIWISSYPAVWRAQ